MWKLRSFMKPYWLFCILAPLLMVLEVSMDLLQPLLMASIVDDGIMKGDIAHIQRNGLLMIGVAFVGLLGGVGCNIFAAMASQNFGNDLRIRLFEQIQSLSFRNLDRLKTGSLITRLTNDVVQLQNFSQMILRMFVRTPMLLIGSLIMAIAISPSLTSVLLVSVPVLILILFFLIKRSFPLFSAMQSKLDGVNTVLQESLLGVRVIKAFVRADYEQDRFDQVNNEYTGTAIKAVRLIALNLPVLTLVLNASIVAVLWFGGLQHWGGTLAVGNLIAFINYMTQLMMSMLMLGGMLAFISRAKVSSDRVNEVLATSSEITEEPDAATAVIHRGRLEFEHVSFAYDEAGSEQVLKDVSFTVDPGQTVAIVGATGSGKSSLVGLIPRFYDVSAGEIRIDGTPLPSMQLDHLRGSIGMVMQQVLLFSGTIRDNLRYGRPEATDEEVITAAKAAQAHDFITNMPEGYDTQLGQRGVNLSGGQKQRLSIARALLTRPSILILDDSMSAVDLATEARIQEALEDLMKDTTCIVIAQRLSTAAGADLILVLEDGRIAAQGTHEELLQTSSIYQDIYRSQHREEGHGYVTADGAQS
ncbi:ABC transporter ATP-binding protein [Paenibacillus massiliensis]|uniref:ABC transporter ATP-binding protein n=1 Tax=Paenibacillus massiliensis TaxID=225917 RepID=UPI00037448F4|nr:ABC transporter ATP-binding protein [Paenibacillus massiliensis]